MLEIVPQQVKVVDGRIVIDDELPLYYLKKVVKPKRRLEGEVEKPKPKTRNGGQKAIKKERKPNSRAQKQKQNQKQQKRFKPSIPPRTDEIPSTIRAEVEAKG